MDKHDFQKGWSGANPNWQGCDYIIWLGKALEIPGWAGLKAKKFDIKVLTKDGLQNCFEVQERP